MEPDFNKDSIKWNWNGDKHFYEKWMVVVSLNVISNRFLDSVIYLFKLD